MTEESRPSTGMVGPHTEESAENCETDCHDIEYLLKFLDGILTVAYLRDVCVDNIGCFAILYNPIGMHSTQAVRECTVSGMFPIGFESTGTFLQIAQSLTSTAWTGILVKQTGQWTWQSGEKWEIDKPEVKSGGGKTCLSASQSGIFSYYCNIKNRFICELPEEFKKYYDIPCSKVVPLSSGGYMCVGSVDEQYRLPWVDAAKLCASYKGSLLTILSQEQYLAIKPELTYGYRFWVGGTTTSITETPNPQVTPPSVDPYSLNWLNKGPFDPNPNLQAVSDDLTGCTHLTKEGYLEFVHCAFENKFVVCRKEPRTTTVAIHEMTTPNATHKPFIIERPHPAAKEEANVHPLYILTGLVTLVVIVVVITILVVMKKRRRRRKRRAAESKKPLLEQNGNYSKHLDLPNDVHQLSLPTKILSSSGEEAGEPGTSCPSAEFLPGAAAAFLSGVKRQRVASSRSGSSSEGSGCLNVSSPSLFTPSFRLAEGAEITYVSEGAAILAPSDTSLVTSDVISVSTGSEVGHKQNRGNYTACVHQSTSPEHSNDETSGGYASPKSSPLHGYMPSSSTESSSPEHLPTPSTSTPGSSPLRVPAGSSPVECAVVCPDPVYEDVTDNPFHPPEQIECESYTQMVSKIGAQGSRPLGRRGPPVVLPCLKPPTEDEPVSTTQPIDIEVENLPPPPLELLSPSNDSGFGPAEMCGGEQAPYFSPLSYDLSTEPNNIVTEVEMHYCPAADDLSQMYTQIFRPTAQQNAAAVTPQSDTAGMESPLGPNSVSSVSVASSGFTSLQSDNVSDCLPKLQYAYPNNNLRIVDKSSQLPEL